jgi:hypothetical protein
MAKLGPLQGEDVLVRNNDELLTTEVDGELVGISLEQGTCYGLNGVATRIWSLLAQPRSIDGLCEELMLAYEVAGDRWREEVIALLEDLRAEGLVTVRTA